MIETERLILREYALQDFDAIYEMLSDSETMQHYPKSFDEERTARKPNSGIPAAERALLPLLKGQIQQLEVRLRCVRIFSAEFLNFSLRDGKSGGLRKPPLSKH